MISLRLSSWKSCFVYTVGFLNGISWCIVWWGVHHYCCQVCLVWLFCNWWKVGNLIFLWVWFLVSVLCLVCVCSGRLVVLLFCCWYNLCWIVIYSVCAFCVFCVVLESCFPVYLRVCSHVSNVWCWCLWDAREVQLRYNHLWQWLHTTGICLWAIAVLHAWQVYFVGPWLDSISPSRMIKRD